MPDAVDCAGHIPNPVGEGCTTPVNPNQSLYDGACTTFAVEVLGIICAAAPRWGTACAEDSCCPELAAAVPTPLAPGLLPSAWEAIAPGVEAVLVLTLLISAVVKVAVISTKRESV